jgi:hypothetical protein
VQAIDGVDDQVKNPISRNESRKSAIFAGLGGFDPVRRLAGALESSPPAN